jgi:hypothetical protein
MAPGLQRAGAARPVFARILHPDSRRFRFLLLFLLCLTAFGHMFNYDSPGPLVEDLKEVSHPIQAEEKEKEEKGNGIYKQKPNTPRITEVNFHNICFSYIQIWNNLSQIVLLVIDSNLE